MAKVAVKKDKVLVAAKAVLKDIENDRARELEPLIKSRIELREFWRKVFFWLKPYTREDALKALERDRNGTYAMMLIHLKRGRQKNVCEQLVKACNIADADTIYLESDEINCLNFG